MLITLKWNTKTRDFECPNEDQLCDIDIADKVLDEIQNDIIESMATRIKGANSKKFSIRIHASVLTTLLKYCDDIIHAKLSEGFHAHFLQHQIIGSNDFEKLTDYELTELNE